MNTDLDDAVRSSLGDIVATAPSPDIEPMLRTAPGSGGTPRRPMLAVAASMIAVIGVAALVHVGSRDPDAAPRSVDAPPTSGAPVTDQPATSDSTPRPTSTIEADPTSPLAVTGQRIGDAIDPEEEPWAPDGEVDPTKLPAWGTVGRDGVIIGYVKPVDVMLGESDITIYGEDEEPIGIFVDGKPSLFTDAATSGENSTAPSPAPLVDITTMRWPTDPWAATDLERLTDIDPRRSIDTYVERAAALTRSCMAEGGPVTSQGRDVPEGCEGWANDLAFPGNHFADDYEMYRNRAAARPEFVIVLDAYRDCLRSRGFDGGPQFDGLDDESAQQLTDTFNNAATDCDDETGLADAQRALEVLTHEALFLAKSDSVRAYAASLTDALNLHGEQTPEAT